MEEPKDSALTVPNQISAAWLVVAVVPDDQDACVQWLAWRYLEGFGPASAADLAQFTLLTRSVARNALDAMAGRLEPILRENPMGQALVKQVFQLTKKGAVAGCLVKSGRISSRARVRIRRQGGVVYEGSLVSLKRFQNDAAEHLYETPVRIISKPFVLCFFYHALDRQVI